MFEEEEYEEQWEFRCTMGGNQDANKCVVQLMRDLSSKQGRLQHTLDMYHMETSNLLQ